MEEKEDLVDFIDKMSEEFAKKLGLKLIKVDHPREKRANSCDRNNNFSEW